MMVQLLHHASHLLLLRMPFVGHEALRDLPGLAQRLQVNASIRGRSTQSARQALRVRTCTIGKDILEPSLVRKTPTM
jgi:hypothetical protein